MKNFAYATLILATACATLSISHAAHADAYRWVSDDGVINFSQRKPRGIPEDRLTRINAKSRSRTVSEPFVATSPTDEQDDEVELTATQQKLLDDLEQTEAERQADIARIRNDNCAARARRVGHPNSTIALSGRKYRWFATRLARRRTARTNFQCPT